MVHANTPVVFRGLAADWPAMRKWTPDYIAQTMGDREVTVAFTPTGFADAPLDGTPYFTMPHTPTLPYPAAYAHLLASADPTQCPDAPLYPDGPCVPRLDPQSMTVTSLSDAPVAYMQTQNGCLADDWAPLAADVPSDIAFATEALGNAPDAVNIWFGSASAATATHKDNYENLYAVVSGVKRFRLWAPSEAWRMHEEMLIPAQYEPEVSEAARSGLVVGPTFRVAVADPESRVPWIRKPAADAPFLDVQVWPGDVLYLPSQWYHAVYQASTLDGIHPLCVAVNWWYDMEYGAAYAAVQLQRSLGYLVRTGAAPPDAADSLLGSESDSDE
ncbi:cupin-like domain-containing protein [Blastocladiella britannica]|nr:cupin-like domain-containing protein [Blastocladiella britannica]